MDILKVALGLFFGSRAFGGGPPASDGAPAYVRQSTGSPTAVPIAVVPFSNLSEDQQADRKVIGYVLARLLSSGAYVVVEPALVDSAMADMRSRADLDGPQMKQLASKLGVRLLLMGAISEYGPSRTGANQATVSLSARLVDTSNSTIVWASVASRTGGADESLFGGGGSPSLSKLTQGAVDQLVKTMVKGRREIALFAKPDTAAAPAAVTQPVGTEPAPTNVTVPTNPGAEPARDPSNAGARFLDEARSYTQDELRALLPEHAGGATRGEVIALERCMMGIQAVYRGDGGDVEVTLIDLNNVSQTKAVVRVRSAEATEAEMEGLTAFSRTSSFGEFHLNLAVGRFGVYLRGASEIEASVRKVALDLVKSMR